MNFQRRGEWVYLSFGDFRPFGFLQHGGWFCLSLPWWKRFLWDVPKQRGWRWG